jgi:peptidoglycan/xylan/chitin deacetylase (PgdA/CDA1 family)
VPAPSLQPRALARRARNAARRIERRLPGRAAVLAYHRVATLDVDPWDLAVSPPHFADQLAVLRGRGTVRRLGELLGDSAPARVRTVRPQFAVTFDDGYVDNLDAALPLLEVSDAPATVFIAPGLLGRSSYWWDVLAALVLGSGLEPHRVVAAAQVTGVIDGAGHGATDAGDARAVHDLLHSSLIRRHVDTIEADLDRLAASLGVDRPVPDGRPMTVAELTTLAAHPLVDIGVHTMTHPRLPDLPTSAARVEIDDCARRLDELVGTCRRVLAYPYGSSSPDVVGIAGDLGFAHAVTTDSRWLRRRSEELSAPRLHPRDVDGPTFDEWLRVWA